MMRRLLLALSIAAIPICSAFAENGHSRAIVEYYEDVRAFEACLREKTIEPCGAPPTPPPVTDEGMADDWPPMEEATSGCSGPFLWLAEAFDVECEPAGPASHEPSCGGPTTDYQTGVIYCARDNDRDDRGETSVGSDVGPSGTDSRVGAPDDRPDPPNDRPSESDPPANPPPGGMMGPGKD